MESMHEMMMVKYFECVRTEHFYLDKLRVMQTFTQKNYLKKPHSSSQELIRSLRNTRFLLNCLCALIFCDKV